MKERPILFSGPMVRALLDGRKTQTRRVVKPQPERDPAGSCGVWFPATTAKNKKHYATERHFCEGLPSDWSPYGVPGDRLWVRETIWHHKRSGRGMPDHDCGGWCYAADGKPEPGWKKSGSIHMPRWASRITLEVVGVRVERVEEITEADAIAEGFGQTRERVGNGINWRGSRAAFLETFYDLNERAPRGTNPWVWVIEFKRIGGAA